MVCFAIIVFASCSEDEPAKMLWEVTATPAESVKAAFDPSFYHQIQITSDGDGGEDGGRRGGSHPPLRVYPGVCRGLGEFLC